MIFSINKNILKKNINNSIIKTLKNYKINNKILGPYYGNNKLYYSLCKPISENKYLLIRNLIRI